MNAVRINKESVLRLLSGSELKKARIAVKMDQAPNMSASGLIHFAPSAMDHVNNTGTVLAVGNVHAKKGTVYPIPGIEPGDRVVVLRFLEEQATNRGVQHALGEDGVVIVSPSDIMVVYTEDEHERLRGVA